jgi:hypothetical protein
MRLTLGVYLYQSHLNFICSFNFCKLGVSRGTLERATLVDHASKFNLKAPPCCAQYLFPKKNSIKIGFNKNRVPET